MKKFDLVDFKKVNKKVLIIGIAIVIILVSAITYTATKPQRMIKQVTQGTFNNYNGNIDEKFNSFLGDPEWSYYTEGGNDYVVCKGTAYYDGQLVETEIKFYLYKNSDDFQATELKINGEVADDWELSSLIETIMQDNGMSGVSQ